jgi:hypothetical protein
VVDFVELFCAMSRLCRARKTFSKINGMQDDTGIAVPHVSHAEPNPALFSASALSAW